MFAVLAVGNFLADLLQRRDSAISERSAAATRGSALALQIAAALGVSARVQRRVAAIVHSANGCKLLQRLDSWRFLSLA